MIGVHVVIVIKERVLVMILFIYHGLVIHQMDGMLVSPLIVVMLFMLFLHYVGFVCLLSNQHGHRWCLYKRIEEFDAEDDFRHRTVSYHLVCLSDVDAIAAAVSVQTRKQHLSQLVRRYIGHQQYEQLFGNYDKNKLWTTWATE
jgi:hypothetical protein